MFRIFALWHMRTDIMRISCIQEKVTPNCDVSQIAIISNRWRLIDLLTYSRHFMLCQQSKWAEMASLYFLSCASASCQWELNYTGWTNLNYYCFFQRLLQNNSISAWSVFFQLGLITRPMHLCLPAGLSVWLTACLRWDRIRYPLGASCGGPFNVLTRAERMFTIC